MEPSPGTEKLRESSLIWQCCGHGPNNPSIAVLASGAAVLAWFGLYKFIYKQSFSPGLPGEGLFKYVVWKDPVNNLIKNRVASKNKASENKWSSKVSIIGGIEFVRRQQQFITIC